MPCGWYRRATSDDKGCVCCTVLRAPAHWKRDTFGDTFEGHLAALEGLPRVDVAQCGGRFERQSPVLVPYDYSPSTRRGRRFDSDGLLVPRPLIRGSQDAQHIAPTLRRAARAGRGKPWSRRGGWGNAGGSFLNGADERVQPSVLWLGSRRVAHLLKGITAGQEQHSVRHA